MYALIGRVKIKPGYEEETRAMIGQHGVPMVQGMAGAAGAYWARALGACRRNGSVRGVERVEDAEAGVDDLELRGDRAPVRAVEGVDCG